MTIGSNSKVKFPSLCHTEERFSSNSEEFASELLENVSLLLLVNHKYDV